MSKSPPPPSLPLLPPPMLVVAVRTHLAAKLPGEGRVPAAEVPFGARPFGDDVAGGVGLGSSQAGLVSPAFLPPLSTADALRERRLPMRRSLTLFSVLTCFSAALSAGPCHSDSVLRSSCLRSADLLPISSSMSVMNGKKLTGSGGEVMALSGYSVSHTPLNATVGGRDIMICRRRMCILVRWHSKPISSNAFCA